MQRRAVLGWTGVLGGFAVWTASALALARTMGRLSQASLLRSHPTRTLPSRASSFDLTLALSCAAFILLQVAALLLFAFVFRASWRMRSAACFSLAAGLVIMGDAAGLFALLLWLGLTLGAG